MGGPFRQGVHVMDGEYLAKLQRLIRARGSYRASVILGCSETVLDSLGSGGGAQRRTLDRVRAALDALPPEPMSRAS